MKKFTTLFVMWSIVTVMIAQDWSKIAFLCNYDDVADFKANADDDEIAAGDWFIGKGGAFLSLNAIKDGTDNLSGYKAIWIHLDKEITDGDHLNVFLTTYLAPFQDPDVLTPLTNFYKAGGNIFLSTHASHYLYDLGRFTTRPENNGFGTANHNGDVWYASATYGTWQDFPVENVIDNSDDQIYAGLDSEPVVRTNGREYKRFPFIGSGLKEDHNCFWHLDMPDPYFNGNPQKFQYIYDIYKATPLAIWDHINDFYGGAIIRWDPKDDYLGKCFTVGLAAYEWNQNGVTNPYQSNIEKLTENILKELAPVTAVTWVGGTLGLENSWITPANWNPTTVPDATIDVTIPGNVAHFPVLAANAACKSITFAPGAELGRQDFLTTYEKAVVQYSLETDRTYLLSMPFQTTAQSFFLKGTPHNLPNTVWLQKFISKGNGAEWDYYPSLTQDMLIGEGFAYYIGSENNEASVSFQIETTALAGKAPNLPALDFGEDINYESWFALAGNPFMTSINFNLLYNDAILDENNKKNADKILQNYQVWTGSGFEGYTNIGKWGIITNLTTETKAPYIAPLQAFFVERKDDTATGKLSFDVETVAAGATGQGELRAVSDNSDKLDIVASNPTASVLTFIANRKNGQSARKLMDEYTEVPDVYTLSDDAKTVLGANIVSTNNITVPIGLATTYAGNMSLTFSGMEDYDAQIKLRDTQEDKEIDLTGMSSYQYDFDYTPPTNTENQIIADESRFYIAFSPTVITDMIDSKVIQNTLVYKKNNAIYVIASFDNPIRQLFVYDVQGRVIYSETNLNTPESIITELQPGSPDVYLMKVIMEKGVKNVKLTR